ncbi:MAG: hypothetical protein H0W76_09345 [Pyrinomonadaceae bacterium]|nr:hypothetical protein [Pyrinomonadaceae bacterium]
MTNEEFQRRREFMLEQQAQFAADIQVLRELQEHSVSIHEKADERITRVENVVMRLTDIVERVVGTVERVTTVQAQADKRLAETDDRLNALIAVVENYLSERRDEKPPS